MKHISALDGIRGVAVLAVIYFHFMLRGGTGVFGVVASLGWMGVDMFLVLSGYLITSILFEQRGAEHFFRNFYTRRALRLFPLYYAIMLMIAVLTPVLHIVWQKRDIAYFFYISNYMLSYHPVIGEIGPFTLFHTWTLSLEEQFYLVWPWLVGNLALSRRRLLQICVGGMVVAPVVRVVLLAFHQPPWMIASGLPTRMDTLLIGSALALIPLPSLRTARIVAAVAFVPIPFLFWLARSLFFLRSPMETIGFTCLAFLCAAVMVQSMYPTTWIHWIANLKATRFYGKYSYGLYLWHQLFAHQFASITTWTIGRLGSTMLGSVLSFPVELFLVTLISMASFRFLEAPFLRLKHRFER